MEPKNTSNKIKDQKQPKLISSNNILRNIKSNFILKIFFGYIHQRKSLELIKGNKYIQKRINTDINSYKAYSEKYTTIEIEIVPINNYYGPFIKIKD